MKSKDQQLLEEAYGKVYKSPKPVVEVIKELEHALASWYDDSEPGDQSALEALEGSGANLLKLSDQEKKVVVKHFKSRWSQTPHIAKMIRDYAFDVWYSPYAL